MYPNETAFMQEGNWYKGNLHSHTTNSDGKLSPEGLVDWYLRNGYDFLAITDHDRITDVTPLQREGIIVFPGIEFGYAPEEEPGFFLDMLGINIRELPDYFGRDRKGRITYDPKTSPQQIIDDVNSMGGMAIMCHPYFMNNLMEPYLKYHSYIGMEVYNYVCEELSDRGNQEIYWDAMLCREKRLLGFATDDSHAPNFGNAWIEVKAKEKTPEAILEAIRAGSYYSTNGVKVYEVEYTQDKVRVSFDRLCTVILKTYEGKVIPPHRNQFELVDGKPRYWIEAEIPKHKTYMRIVLKDMQGNKAFINPVYFTE